MDSRLVMRPLSEAPGNLLRQRELDDAIPILSIWQMFFWDCNIFDAGFKKVFFTSHAEFCGFYCCAGVPQSLCSAFADGLRTRE